MGKIIAVFNNRNHSMQFASLLKKMGVACKTINTPRELSVSCGISVIFSSVSLRQAEYIIKSYKFSTFVGFYETSNRNFTKKY